MAAFLAASMAAATIWLVLTDPVTVVDAVNEGTVSPLVSALTALLYEALGTLASYL